MEDILKQSVYLDEGLLPEDLERRHLLHKLVYDCLNQLLDYKRVYGIDGVPLRFTPRFKPKGVISHQNCSLFLEEAKQKVVEYCSYRAGILPEKEPGLVSLEGVDAIEVIREELFKRILTDFVSWRNLSLLLILVQEVMGSSLICVFESIY